MDSASLEPPDTWFIVSAMAQWRIEWRARAPFRCLERKAIGLQNRRFQVRVLGAPLITALTAGGKACTPQHFRRRSRRPPLFAGWARIVEIARCGDFGRSQTDRRERRLLTTPSLPAASDGNKRCVTVEKG